jgi:hypothetical protein
MTGTTKPFKSYGFGGLLSAKFPPREPLLDPWLDRRAISMIYGWRGLGKTTFAQTTAYVLATGGEFLGWRAPVPVKVLYVDGEMDPAELTARFLAIHNTYGATAQVSPDEYLETVTHATADGPWGIPDLSDPDANGRDRIEETLGDRDVLILDNISSLCRSGVENDAESWGMMAEWLVRLRRLGKTTIVIHHAGKNGQQRGTSKREDLMNTVIAIEGGEDANAKSDRVIKFTKTRGFTPPDPMPIRIEWSGNGQLVEFVPRDDEDESARVAKIRQLLDEGWTQARVAEELGVSQSYVSKKRGSAGSGKRGRKSAGDGDGVTVH